MAATQTAISDEKAARMMAALREGQTLRRFGVKAPRLEAFFKAHPDYEKEARPLIEANAKAAHLRKATAARVTTHCRAGLHLMSGNNVKIQGPAGGYRRYCAACRRATDLRARPIRAEEIVAVKAALLKGVSIGQITHGRPVGGRRRKPIADNCQQKILKRYRQEDAEFNRFVMDAISDSLRVGQRLRHQRERNAAKREQINDYHKIRDMIPERNPHRDDIVARIFEDLLGGLLMREDVPARITRYIAEFNRLYPTKFAKFGEGRLLSLDEALYEDGGGARIDTVTRGLWD
ncbi:hypothetical protein V1290_000225 [Bradyrhizobium sp. AZCC 1578]|uniref:hypothetical protein n=1 Tax=Bradyrhizobium sp. AZCC 1578 TaxID=3117027 RepID=UPI002FF20B0A